jgi:hypothetical protein
MAFRPHGRKKTIHDEIVMRSRNVRDAWKVINKQQQSGNLPPEQAAILLSAIDSESDEIARIYRNT